jgi:hypothetical protein
MLDFVVLVAYIGCLYVVVKGVNWIFAHPRGKQNLVIHDLVKNKKVHRQVHKRGV